MKSAAARIALMLTMPLLLAACASGYQSFYTPSSGWTPESMAKLRAAPPPATPILERFAPAEPDVILAAYAKRGYLMIGYSSFNSGHSESETSALKQGQKVGADLVLVLNPQYTGSITTSMPITTPTSSTSYSTGTATAYGSGGSVTAYGSGTTTTYGNKTTYVPMTVNRSDYGAVYFIKQHFNFGAITRDLNDAERRELQTNQGVVVLTIVDGTPAFNSDVLPGDFIAEMDGEKVANSEAFSRMIGERIGKRVAFTLFRHGQKVDKSVQLND